LTAATGNAGGTITFSLYAPSAPTCTGTPAYTQTVTVNGNGTYSTTNTTFFAGIVGTWRWVVAYSGDNNNTGATSACGVENFTLTTGKPESRARARTRGPARQSRRIEQTTPASAPSPGYRR
jgi:hypothetical protein